VSGVSAAIDAQWSILLAACSTLPHDQKQLRLRSVLSTSVGWQEVFALAERHGVQPLLCQALEPLREAIPPKAMQELEQIYQTNLHKALLMSRELIRIVHHLRSFDLDVMSYKGAALAEFLYRDVALRQTGDIDLLVRREEFSRVQDALEKIAYVPQVRFSEVEQRAYLKSGYECVFDGPAGRNILEVQWAIEPRFYSVDFDMDGVFDRAVKVEVAGQEMKTPSAPDLFLILAVHAAKHAWDRLIWICDIARLMRPSSMDWDWIASRAASLGVLRIVNISMLLAHRLLGAAIPETAGKWFAEDEYSIRFVSRLQQKVMSAADSNVESVSYFRLAMQLRERLSDRLRFATRLALTPGPGEWKAVRLPPRLFPVYRVVRLARLLGRAVGA
jgi:Uncharacterised nucleotidyltransferase